MEFSPPRCLNRGIFFDKEANLATAIENIDIGGPAMVRGAAKNYNDVTVITDICQYNDLINELNKNKGATSKKFRKTRGQNRKNRGTPRRTKASHIKSRENCN